MPTIATCVLTLRAALVSALVMAAAAQQGCSESKPAAAPPPPPIPLRAVAPELSVQQSALGVSPFDQFATNEPEPAVAAPARRAPKARTRRPALQVAAAPPVVAPAPPPPVVPPPPVKKERFGKRLLKVLVSAGEGYAQSVLQRQQERELQQRQQRELQQQQQFQEQQLQEQQAAKPADPCDKYQQHEDRMACMGLVVPSP